MGVPSVFISYSHDSQEHKQWVLNFATRLRSSGVDAILDQWELGPGSDLPHFMEQNLARASRVLMICTERYVEKANSGIGGVGYEKMIVTADLLKTIDSSVVIPIVRQTGSVKLPTFLRTKMYVDLSSQDRLETGFDELLRAILRTPLFSKPPLGSDPFRSVAGTAVPMTPTPLMRLMQAIGNVYDKVTNAGAIRTDTVRESMNTSRIFFDYARDQAVELGYIKSDGAKDWLWIQNRGRALLVEIVSAEREKSVK
jgi:hypothetical protein